MSWLDSPGFERRPVVFVEDHLYHTGEVLAAIAARRSEMLSDVTVCAIDRPGPDTDAAIAEWLAAFPQVQVAALTSLVEPRLRPLAASALESMPSFAACLASLLRPGGVLVQDVQLSTLPFIPPSRWWESIYVAATVRGILASRPPTVRLLSNKQGYAATFGRDLVDAGFDPRDVIDKSEMALVAVPAIAALVDRQFPLAFEARSSEGHRRTARVADADRDELGASLDILLWPSPEGFDLCGRLVKRATLRADSHEAQTWIALIRDHLDRGEGLPVLSVGARVGPPDLGRAEATNIAARHVHTLRARLQDPAAIVTAQHAYRLAAPLAVGLATRDLRRPPGLTSRDSKVPE